jgi:hypothetical protein
MFNKKCNHEWEKVTELITQSRAEVMKDIEFKPQGLAPSDFDRTFILVLKCLKCGDLDKTIKELGYLL